MPALKSLRALLVIGVLAGCTAEGPLHKEVAASIPTVPAGKGRVYFYRPNTLFGAAITSDITLNGRVIGKSERGGFFFVDEPPGNCKASVSTEVEREVTFTLAAGETKYIKSTLSIGVMVHRVNLELVSPGDANNEISELHYTGQPLTKY